MTSYKRLHRGLAAVGFLIWLGGTARADRDPFLEIGGFAGIHGFSDRNGLGRPNGAPTSTAPDHSIIFGPRIGIPLGNWLTLEGEVGFAPTLTKDGSTDVLAMLWRGHFILHLLDGPVRPFLLGGGGAYTVLRSTKHAVLDEDTDSALHGGGGIKWNLSDAWAVRLDGRVLLPPTTEHNTLVTYDWEALVGISARIGAVRTPPPPPPPPPPADTDGDGIPDTEDECPTEVGRREDRGCPVRDSDGDKILDKDDKCPNEAGIPENGGCPDRDGDGDGIVDRLDKCPNEPETRNGYEDDDGCPDEVPQAVKEFSGVIEGITFKTGSAEIAPSSFPVLDKAAAVLTEYPSVRLEVGGHTDNKGKHDYNVGLSQRRAESVVRYMTGKGVDASRLTAVGYGPDKPLGSNKTSQGRAQNRRVEFQLIQQPRTEPGTPKPAEPGTSAPETPALPESPAPTKPESPAPIKPEGETR